MCVRPHRNSGCVGGVGAWWSVRRTGCVSQSILYYDHRFKVIIKRTNTPDSANEIALFKREKVCDWLRLRSFWLWVGTCKRHKFHSGSQYIFSHSCDTDTVFFSRIIQCLRAFSGCECGVALDREYQRAIECRFSGFGNDVLSMTGLMLWLHIPL